MKVVQKHESLILDWQDGLHATFECGYGDGNGYGIGYGDGNGNGYGDGFGFGNRIDAII